MRPSRAFRATLGLYYLALGTWFGTTLMMGVAAATTFRTARALSPTLPAAPAAVTHHGEYLAGEMVNASFTAMSAIQCACAAIVAVVLVLQWTLWREALGGRDRGRRVVNGVRTAMLVGAVAILAGDLALLRPRMGSLRASMYDEAVPAAARDGARASFDSYHRASERLLGAASLAVGAGVLISPFVLTGGPSRSSET